MAHDHTPYWFWPLDRWKLLLTLVLALLLLLVGAMSQPGVTAVMEPVLQQPASGSAFAAGEPVQIEGIATPEQIVRILLCPVDDDDLPQCDEESAYPLAEITADATGHWQLLAPPLAPGQHGIVAVARDEAGHSRSSSVITFKIQSAAPTVIAPSFNSPDRAEQPSQPITLTGEAGPGNEVFLFVDQSFLGSTRADEKGLWRFTAPDLPVGTHFLVAKVLAPNGEELAVSEPFIVLVVSEQ